MCIKCNYTWILGIAFLSLQVEPAAWAEITNLSGNIKSITSGKLEPTQPLASCGKEAELEHLTALCQLFISLNYTFSFSSLTLKEVRAMWSCQTSGTWPFIWQEVLYRISDSVCLTMTCSLRSPRRVPPIPVLDHLTQGQVSSQWLSTPAHWSFLSMRAPLSVCVCVHVSMFKSSLSNKIQKKNVSHLSKRKYRMKNTTWQKIVLGRETIHCAFLFMIHNHLLRFLSKLPKLVSYLSSWVNVLHQEKQWKLLAKLPAIW